MISIGTQVVLATGNLGKRREFEALLAPLQLQWITQAELNIAPAPEPFETFLENALAKARHASKQSGLPSLADDSGICVESLGGKPGVLSARYAGEGANDALNNAQLVKDLQGITNRRAKYVCVLVFIRHANDPEPVIAVGNWHGEVIDTAKGENGFGYDSHFYLPKLGKTAAELDLPFKNSISHRAIAAQLLLQQLQDD
jgi:XTP/dITP diphosphohydrolase